MRPPIVFRCLCRFVTALAWYLFSLSPASAMEAPHNAASGVTCPACHGTSRVSSPFWGGSLSDEGFDNFCLLNCHDKVGGGPYSSVDAPWVQTHSSANSSDTYGTWHKRCLDCHHQHSNQQNSRDNRGLFGDGVYLATAEVDSWSYDSGADESTVDYSGLSLKGSWSVAALLAKTSDNRRAILVPSLRDPRNNFQVTGMTESGGAGTVTVKGNIGSVRGLGGYPLGFTYNQFLREEIDTDGDGEDDTVVRFIDRSGTGSFVDGDASYNGICQACHTQTAHFRRNGTGGASDQLHANIGGAVGSNCTANCHKHENGFAHGGGGGDGGCGDLACHGGSGSHDPHLNDLGMYCTGCHEFADMPYFKSGTDENEDGRYDLSETDTCDVCHQDGTVVATGVLVPVGPPEWGVDDIDCGGCHDNGPAYGDGSLKANSHPAHSGLSCDNCHNATTKDGAGINNQNVHLSSRYNLNPGNGVHFAYTFDAGGGSCSNISCHGNTSAVWGGGDGDEAGACLSCHGVSQGSRAAITPQFSANSHHVQGVDIKNKHCYQCHWEANSDGTINLAYHGGYFDSGAPVDLVIYRAGTRPASYVDQSTATAYSADGSRGEIVKINAHCLGCHSDANNDTEPFGDCKTPRQYAWDRNSVAARYSQAGTTNWGKYSTDIYPNVATKDITKAYSAHGNAVNNGGGFSASTGLDESIPNTRDGFENVLCFDCHNSHGSGAAGTTTSYTTYDNTRNGGILKDTSTGKGGYALSYTPEANPDNSDKNPYATGADLCFDCHLSQNAARTPWGYEQTFGATAPILGYKDGRRFGTSNSGTKQRFSYKRGRVNQGGHFMASSSLKGLNGSHEGNEALYQINGLCTPCHDPHGVSPSLGDHQAYGVPLLKGTWLTSPYKEDSPEMTGTRGGDKSCRGCDTNQDRHWNTDRVTFDTNDDLHDGFGQITEDDTVFAGLCLRCHPKSNLTDGTDGTGAAGWKGVDRLHETVKGWGSNDEHLFSCSKCHVPHNSGLPRLMQTNCLNFNHRQQMITGGSPTSASGTKGWGKFPGQSNKNFYDSLDACHEGASAANDANWPSNQLWNNVTPW